MLRSDPFTDWLRFRGTVPGVYQPAGYLGAPPIGWTLSVGHSDFVYRVPENEPQTLIIVLFVRNGERSGLRSPFADIVRFISLVKRSGAGIHTIQGRVDALADRPADSLENDRIAAFYQRYLAAYHLFQQDGVDWFAGDLRTYVPPLLKDRQWLATPQEVALP
ncbi:MAG: hypothetical protein QM796_21400 [Chthoniobacteraceae bacterium]